MSIVSVQRFQITLAAGTQSGSADVAGGTVVANCIPFITKHPSTRPTSGDNWNETTVRAVMETTPTNRVTVSTATYAVRVMVVEVTVVEFDGTDTVVQTGTATLTTSGDPVTATISPSLASINNAFLYFTWISGGAASQNFDHFNVSGRITAVNEITFDRMGASNTMVIRWYVAEAKSTPKDFTVEHFTITVGNGQSSNTGTISKTAARTFLMGSFEGAVSSDDNEDNTFAISLSGTTVTVKRQITSTGVCTYYGQAIEFDSGSNGKVQRGTVTQTTTPDDDETVTIPDAVDTSRVQIINAGNVSAHSSGAFDGITGDSDAQCGWRLVDSTHIAVRHNIVTGDVPYEIPWEVIEWPTAGPPPSRRVFVIT